MCGLNLIGQDVSGLIDFAMALSRRQFVASAAAAATLGTSVTAGAQSSAMTLKSGHALPRIGMGTWLTFHVKPGSPEFRQRHDVLRAFYEGGGGMIDSSPMYAEAEAAIGALMADHPREAMFSATKIWTTFPNGGPMQIGASHELWGEPVLDLVHVHNLLQWEAHLKTLRAAKDNGQVRFIGLTTSHGRRHEKLEELMKSEPIDAVQFSYNILNRTAEERLLPVARDQGIKVIINRPFMTSQLFRRVEGHAVPEFVKDIGINNWAAYFLKFILSHFAVDCVIPATSQASHMRQNMAALQGELPDNIMRERMAAYFKTLL